MSKENKAGQWQSCKPRGVHSPCTYMLGNDDVRLWSLLQDDLVLYYNFHLRFFFRMFFSSLSSCKNHEVSQTFCIMNIPKRHVFLLSSLPVKHWTMSTWENLHSYHGISPHRAWIKHTYSWVGLVVAYAPQGLSALLIYKDLSFPQKLSACICCRHLSKHETYLKQKVLSLWSKAFDY